jgi:hypothetical protein
MKVIYAWLDVFGAPAGKIYINGWHIDGKRPDDVSRCAGLMSFTVCKGESMDDIKAHLRHKRDMYHDACERLRAMAQVRVIGSDRQLYKAQFIPLKARGTNVNML